MRHGSDRERRRGIHATARAGPGFSWLDVKLGLRMLLKQPTLTVVGGLTLAFGIPVGLFPWHMTRIMVQPLPVDEAERIQAIRYIDTEEVDYVPPSMETFGRLRESLASFESIGVTTMAMSLNVTTGGASAPEWGAQVTASVFGTLRVAPLLGRTLIDDDEVPGASPVAVISSDLWQSRLASDPDVIGATIEVGGVPHTVVGVMPEGFHYPYQDDVWVPVRVRELVDESRADWGPGHLVFGRLVDGVSPEQAQAEFAAVHRALALESPDTYERLEPEVVPFTAGMFNDPADGVVSDPEFFIMQLCFLLVLVVACTNVGMLTLARASIRSSELAVRTALGASRARIVSQLFIESLVLAVLAAGFGLLVGQWVVLPALLSAFGETFPRWFDVGASPETVVWALSLAALSAAVVGVVPALKATGKSVHRNIQRAAVDRSGIRFGGLSSTLLVIDVALAVSVLGVAGMFYSGVSDSVRRGPAIASDEFLYAEVSLPRIAFTEGGARFDAVDFTARTREAQLELMRRLREEPGVRGVALGSSVIRMRGTAIELDDGPGGGVRRGSLAADVDVDFFSALGHPVRLGRDFTPADAEQGTAVIINQSFVDLVLGGSNPLGRRLRYAPRNEEPGPWLEIVGVVDDITMNESSPGNDRGFYRPPPRAPCIRWRSPSTWTMSPRRSPPGCARSSQKSTPPRPSATPTGSTGPCSRTARDGCSPWPVAASSSRSSSGCRPPASTRSCLSPYPSAPARSASASRWVPAGATSCTPWPPARWSRSSSAA